MSLRVILTTAGRVGNTAPVLHERKTPQEVGGGPEPPQAEAEPARNQALTVLTLGWPEASKGKNAERVE